jgi:hypothetical protein
VLQGCRLVWMDATLHYHVRSLEHSALPLLYHNSDEGIAWSRGSRVQWQVLDVFRLYSAQGCSPSRLYCQANSVK